MRATLRAVKEKLRARMHHSLPAQGRWLRSVVKGYFAYHAVPTNSRALAAYAPAAQSERSADVGTDDEARGVLVAYISYPTSLARSAVSRQLPAVGARCVNCARRDLCGGYPVMGIPTAIRLPVGLAAVPQLPEGGREGRSPSNRSTPVHLVSNYRNRSSVQPECVRLVCGQVLRALETLPALNVRYGSTR
jgi:hypothetical protein